MNKLNINIGLKSIFLYIAGKWKSILCIGIIVAIIGGVTDIKRVDQEDEADSGQLEYTIALKQELSDMETYYNNSVLMKINPYHIYQNVLYFQFRENSQQTTLDKQTVIQMCENYIVSGKIAEDILPKLREESEAQYIEEIVTVGNLSDKETDGLTIIIRSDTKEKGDDLAENIEYTIGEYVSKVTEEYTVVLVDDQQGVVIDKDIAELQNDFIKAFETLKGTYVSYRVNLSEKQQRILDGESAEEIELEKNREVSNERNSLNYARIILGFLLGCFLAILINFFRCIYSNKLIYKEDFENNFPMRVLGTIYQFENRKCPIDRWLLCMERNGETYGNNNEQMEMICAQVEASCKQHEINQLCLCNHYKSEWLNGYMEQILEKLKQTGIEVFYEDSMITDSNSFRKIKETGNVIFIEKRRASFYKDIQKQKELCEEYNIQIFGSIIFC